jgi:hypothetical protein
LKLLQIFEGAFIFFERRIIMDKIVQKSSLIFLFIGVLFGGFIGLNASAYAEKPKQETQINSAGCSRWIVEGYYKNIYKSSTKYVAPKIDKKEAAIKRMMRA